MKFTDVEMYGLFSVDGKDYFRCPQHERDGIQYNAFITGSKVGEGFEFFSDDIDVTPLDITSYLEEKSS